MRHVSPEPNSGCWLWTGSVNHKGYGRVYHRKTYPTASHRVAYELFVGEIPEGLQIDHLCRVRCCVNPNHLEPVTCAENVRRGNSCKTSKGAPVGLSVRTCINGHPMHEANVYHYRNLEQCRTCNAESHRASYARARKGLEQTAIL